jgi:WD40 repeat protein/ankyrin repeat protein
MSNDIPRFIKEKYNIEFYIPKERIEVLTDLANSDEQRDLDNDLWYELKEILFTRFIPDNYEEIVYQLLNAIKGDYEQEYQIPDENPIDLNELYWNKDNMLNPLHVAAMYSLNIVKMLINHFRMDINKPNLNESGDTGGQTPLHYAIQHNQIDIVKHLLTFINIDINKQDFYGETPLYEAIKLRNTKIINLLINAGADPDIKSDIGYSSAELAKDSGISLIISKDIMNLFSNANSQDDEIIEDIKDLIKQDESNLIDIKNAKSDEGNTILLHYIINKKTKVVDYLIDIYKKEDFKKDVDGIILISIIEYIYKISESDGLKLLLKLYNKDYNFYKDIKYELLMMGGNRKTIESNILNYIIHLVLEKTYKDEDEDDFKVTKKYLKLFALVLKIYSGTEYIDKKDYINKEYKLNPYTPLSNSLSLNNNIYFGLLLQAGHTDLKGIFCNIKHFYSNEKLKWDRIKLLVDAGLDLSMSCDDSELGFDFLINQKHTDYISPLLDKLDNAYHNLELFKYILKKDKNNYMVSQKDRSGQTYLMKIMEKFILMTVNSPTSLKLEELLKNIIILLIEKGSDVYYKNENNYSVIDNLRTEINHYYNKKKYGKIVDLLRPTIFILIDNNDIEGIKKLWNVSFNETEIRCKDIHGKSNYNKCVSRKDCTLKRRTRTVTENSKTVIKKGKKQCVDKKIYFLNLSVDLFNYLKPLEYIINKTTSELDFDFLIKFLNEFDNIILNDKSLFKNFKNPLSCLLKSKTNLDSFLKESNDYTNVIEVIELFKKKGLKFDELQLDHKISYNTNDKLYDLLIECGFNLNYYDPEEGIPYIIRVIDDIADFMWHYRSVKMNHDFEETLKNKYIHYLKFLIKKGVDIKIREYDYRSPQQRVIDVLKNIRKDLTGEDLYLENNICYSHLDLIYQELINMFEPKIFNILARFKSVPFEETLDKIKNLDFNEKKSRNYLNQTPLLYWLEIKMNFEVENNTIDYWFIDNIAIDNNSFALIIKNIEMYEPKTVSLLIDKFSITNINERISSPFAFGGIIHSDSNLIEEGIIIKINLKSSILDYFIRYNAYTTEEDFLSIINFILERNPELGLENNNEETPLEVVISEKERQPDNKRLDVIHKILLDYIDSNPICKKLLIKTPELLNFQKIYTKSNKSLRFNNNYFNINGDIDPDGNFNYYKQIIEKIETLGTSSPQTMSINNLIDPQIQARFKFNRGHQSGIDDGGVAEDIFKHIGHELKKNLKYNEAPLDYYSISKDTDKNFIKYLKLILYVSITKALKLNIRLDPILLILMKYKYNDIISYIKNPKKIFFVKSDELIYDSNIVDISTTSDPKKIVIGTWGFKVYVYDLHSKSIYYEIDRNEYNINAISLSSDSKNIAVGSNDNKLTIYSLEEKKESYYQYACNSEINAVAFSSDLKYIAVACKDEVIIYNNNTQDVYHKFKQNGYIYAISFSPDSKTLVAGGRDYQIYFYNLKDKSVEITESANSPREDSFIRFIEYSLDSKYIAWGPIRFFLNGIDENKGIELYLNTNKRRKCVFLSDVKKKGNTPECISFTADSEYLVCGEKDGTIQIFTLLTYLSTEHIPQHNLAIRWTDSIDHGVHITSISCTSDSKYIIVGDINNKVTFYEKENNLIEKVLIEIKKYNDLLFKPGVKYELFRQLLNIDNKYDWDLIGLEYYEPFKEDLGIPLGQYLFKIRKSEHKDLKDSDSITKFYNFDNKKNLLVNIFNYLIFGDFEILHNDIDFIFNVFYNNLDGKITPSLTNISDEVNRLSLKDIEMLMNGKSKIDFKKFKEEIYKNSMLQRDPWGRGIQPDGFVHFSEYSEEGKKAIKKKLDITFEVIEEKYNNDPYYLNILLEFITGSNNLPVNGYNGYKPEKIQFIFIVGGATLAHSHTCFKQLELTNGLFDSGAHPSLEYSISEDILKQASYLQTQIGGGNILLKKYLKYKYKYTYLKNKFRIKYKL